MFAVIFLMLTVIDLAMMFLAIEAKAKGWWVWLILSGMCFIGYLSQIQS